MLEERTMTLDFNEAKWGAGKMKSMPEKEGGGQLALSNTTFQLTPKPLSDKQRL